MYRICTYLENAYRKCKGKVLIYLQFHMTTPKPQNIHKIRLRRSWTEQSLAAQRGLRSLYYEGGKLGSKSHYFVKEKKLSLGSG